MALHEASEGTQVQKVVLWEGGSAVDNTEIQWDAECNSKLDEMLVRLIIKVKTYVFISRATVHVLCCDQIDHGGPQRRCSALRMSVLMHCRKEIWGFLLLLFSLVVEIYQSWIPPSRLDGMVRWWFSNDFTWSDIASSYYYRGNHLVANNPSSMSSKHRSQHVLARVFSSFDGVYVTWIHHHWHCYSRKSIDLRQRVIDAECWWPC
jgi:hypothetical protein